ncbi:cytochrome P450 [Xylariales sp. AK1849]|nr:cytochrome P450 [Xylariales sp. AK1849]
MMDALFAHSPASLLLAASVLWLVSVSLYRLYLHPLANIPGPRLAAITSIWYARQIRKGLFNFSTDLHQKYGPIVRVSPNEVTCNSKEALQEIYGGGRYIQKGDWYYYLRPATIDYLFRRHPKNYFTMNGEMDVDRYRGYRRAIGTTFSTASLKKYSARIDEVMQRFVVKLSSHDGETLDLADWLHLALVECVSVMVLDWSPGYIDDETDHGWLRASLDGWIGLSVFGHLPTLITLTQKWPSVRPIAMWMMGIENTKPKEVVSTQTAFPKLIAARVADASNPSTKRAGHVDMLAELLEVSEKKPSWKPEYSGGMCNVTLNAGHETMTSAAVSVVSLICQSPDIKQRVLDEVRQSKEDREYVNACIREALRVVPVVSMSLPRKIPAGPPLKLHGYDLPPGISVGINPVSLHVNAEIFGPDANEFRPERWLENPEDAKKLDKASLAWGGGPHTCPGRNMAELILYRFIPLLFREFDIEVDVPDIAGMNTFNYVGILSGVKARFWARDKFIY